jgi:hypothetical protein
MNLSITIIGSLLLLVAVIVGYYIRKFETQPCPTACLPLQPLQPLQPLPEVKPALFSKTRIFLTVSEKDEPVHASRGECYLLDIPGLLPFQANQSIVLKTQENSFYVKITSILWLPEHNCMGVYTEILDCKSEQFSGICYTAEVLGFQPIKSAT